MNLLKLQDQLKGIPDNNLVTMVQQPTGQMPQFLVLAEIQRRKDMRESTQASPDSTVADDLEQQGLAALQPPPQEEAPMEGAPEQMDAGLAALPTDMPEAPSMAGGGIVAFAKGDLIGGDIKPLTATQFARLTPADQRAYVAKFGAPPLAGAEKGADLIKSIFGGEVNPAEPSYAQRLQGILGAGPGENVFQNVGRAVATEAQSPAYGVLAASKPKPLASAMTPPGLTPADIKQAGMDLASQPMPAQAAPVAAPIATAGIGAGRAPAMDSGLLKWTDIPSTDADYDALKRPVRSAEEAMAEMQTMLGTDEGLATLKDKLAGMEAKAAGEEEQSLGMALLRAGLGMAAGTSPFALTNIAAGGIEGVKDYAAAKERLDAKQEKRFEIESRISQAERAEKVAAAKYGVESKEADEKREDIRQLKKLENKVNIDVKNAEGKFNAQKENADIKLKKEQLAIQRTAANKPPAEIQVLNWLKDPKNAEAYAAYQGTKKGPMLEDDYIKAYTSYYKQTMDEGEKPVPYATFKAQFTGGAGAAPMTLPAGVTVKRN